MTPIFMRTQLPIGSESDLTGLVDLVGMKVRQNEQIEIVAPSRGRTGRRLNAGCVLRWGVWRRGAC